MATFRVFGIPVTLDFSPPSMLESEALEKVEEMELMDRLEHSEHCFPQDRYHAGQARKALLRELDEAGMVAHSEMELGAFEEEPESEDDEEEPEEEEQSSGFLWGLFG